jgi:hypothetical protein
MAIECIKNETAKTPKVVAILGVNISKVWIL